jgi:DNA-directed RNA polymerase subunit D
VVKIKILEKKDNSVRFLLKDSYSVFANTLRRIIKSEVPVMAIDDIYISKNSSPLYDEMIGLRLGLIPLKTDLKTYIPPEKCKCQTHCSHCSVTLTLRKQGPCYVYSQDLVSDDPRVVPVHEKIPIVFLAEKQVLEIEAIAKLGISKNHVKWSPGLATYKNLSKVEVDTKLCTSCLKCIDACPRKILRKVPKKKIIAQPIYECSYCKSCEEACDTGAIKVTRSDRDFVFYVESFGQLPVDEIILQSAKILNKKAKDFIKLVSK